MNLYEAVKNNLTEAHELKSEEDLESKYEILYRRVSRLEDMDDFTDEMLLQINELINKGIDVATAFSQVIDEKYEFGDATYFKPALEYYSDNLKEILQNSIKSTDLGKNWSAELNYLASNTTIVYNGQEYTLDQLKDRL